MRISCPSRMRLPSTKAPARTMVAPARALAAPATTTTSRQKSRRLNRTIDAASIVAPPSLGNGGLATSKIRPVRFLILECTPLWIRNANKIVVWSRKGFDWKRFLFFFSSFSRSSSWRRCLSSFFSFAHLT